MERVLCGLAAAPGEAVGPAHRVRPPAGERSPRSDAAGERAALVAAIAAAREEIGRLATARQGAEAELLAFQDAMLADEALTGEAFRAIAGGTAADRAWRETLRAEIAGYRTSSHEHFRARAADLEDIRDRVLRHLIGETEDRPPAGAILVAEDLPPTQFLAVDWSAGGGVALGSGSPASHVAMLARAKGVPMVVGLGPDWADLTGPLVLDGTGGRVIVSPDDETVARAGRRVKARRQAGAQAQARLLEPAVTLDGTRVQILVNVAGGGELAGFPVEACDGIGLTRTEFLIEGAWEDEERQLALYRDLLRWAAGRPVTIRTLDAGGDKPIPGYTVPGEGNPFLGLRGIRLSLRHPPRLAVQLRALCRAAAEGPVRIMLPMVTRQDEIDRVGEILDGVVVALEAQGIAHARPPLGIMVEVPALALAVEGIRADFLSIGSNDLVQYATAAARDEAGVADYADPLHPGVMAMIAHVARHGSAGGRPVSLCGDAGADPRVIPALLAAGLRVLSVAPGLVAGVKAAIRQVDLAPMGRSGP